MSYVFYALSENKKSNEITINTYQEPTEDELKSEKSILDQLKAIEKEAGVNGYVPTSDIPIVIDEMYNAAKKMAADDGLIVEEIEKNQYGVTVRFESGITYVYTIEQEGVEEGKGNTELSVVTLEPYVSSRGSSDAHPLTSFSSKSEYIGEAVKNVKFTQAYNDEDVTFENIKKAFLPNSFIVWHGHGLYSKDESYLATGEIATIKEMAKHTMDLVTGKMVVTGSDRFAVNYRYFNDVVDDLSNSFVYLGGCHTGQDKYLMSVMRWKNADVVLGFTDSVLSSYDCNVYYELVDNLCSIDTTGQYTKFSDALAVTLNDCGHDDGDDTPAKTIFMGNEDYRFPKPNLNVVDIYREYLDSKYDTSYGPVRIAFCDIDNDIIPEAVIEQEGDIGIEVSRIVDEHVVTLNYALEFYYIPEKNDILEMGGDGESEEKAKYRIDNDHLIFVDGVGWYIDYESGSDEIEYFKVIDNGSYFEKSTPITKEDYQGFTNDISSYKTISFNDMYDSVEEAFEAYFYNDNNSNRSVKSSSDTEMSEDALVIHEMDYIKNGSKAEIDQLKNTLTSSKQWKQYQAYENGEYALDFDKFNIRRDGPDSYILDYAGGFVVNISVDSGEIGIYVMTEYRDEIKNFR